MLSHKLEILPYVTKRVRPARRGTPAIPKGTEVFLISTARRKEHYWCCYTRKSDAEIVRDRLMLDLDKIGWQNLLDFNFKSDPEDCLGYAGEPIT